MQYLDNIVENLNNKIITNLTGEMNYYGLVTSAKNDRQSGWVDKEGKNVHFNSDKDFNFYHRINKVSASPLEKNPGKKKIYEVTAQIELPVFTSCRNFDEWIMTSIGKMSNLQWLNTDYDSYRILKNEIGASDYNFNTKYIFVVTYNALFQSDLCLARDASSPFIC